MILKDASVLELIYFLSISIKKVNYFYVIFYFLFPYGALLGQNAQLFPVFPV